MLPDYFLRDADADQETEGCEACERLHMQTMLCFDCAQHPRNQHE